MQNELAEVRVFVRIARVGSFSAAARELGLTPSAVSKLMQRMENRLGVRLFYRTSRALALTDDGAQIYDVGCKALDAMDELADLSAGRVAEVRGQLRVHTLLTFAVYQLAPLLPEFQLRFPKVQIEFILGPEPVDLVARNIDVAIHVGTPLDSRLISRTIAHCRWILCASPAYIERHGMPLEPEELRDHQCLNFAGRAEWNLWPLRGLPTAYKTERGPFATNQGEMMLALARQGLGIVRLVDYHVAQDLREGRLVPVLESFNAGDSQPICLMYQSRENLSPRVQRFRDFIVEHFQGDAPWLR